MILTGDVRAMLDTLSDNSVHMCVTSPPYWSLRDYGVQPSVWGGAADCEHEWGGVERSSQANGVHGPNGRGKNDNYSNPTKEAGQFCVACNAWLGCLGLEPTPDLYVEHIVLVFREVRRVLRDDGTLWLNLGDCYAAGQGGSSGDPKDRISPKNLAGAGQRIGSRSSFRRDRLPRGDVAHKAAPGLKPKDLVGIPWMVAFALRDDGWYLRADNIWSKDNPMPEAVLDRTTKSHEYVFMLSKNESYYYDAEAIREDATGNAHGRGRGVNPKAKATQHGGRVKANQNYSAAIVAPVASRNRRSVWAFPTQPFKGAHFATYPERLVELCVKAGTSAHGQCPVCGEPFERIVVRGRELREQKIRGGCNQDGQYHGKAQKVYAGTGAQNPSAVKARILAGMRERVTVGWRPTCACGGRHIRLDAISRRRRFRAWYMARWQSRIDHQWASLFIEGPTPAVVLDPFLGSGTAGLVSRKLKRSFVGIELNPEYAEMAKKRTADNRAKCEAGAPPQEVAS